MRTGSTLLTWLVTVDGVPELDCVYTLYMLAILLLRGEQARHYIHGSIRETVWIVSARGS
jgi:hypothetical protein